MPVKDVGKKRTAMNAAAQKYPNLDAVLKRIENTSHRLELTDGRYAYIKYLKPIYKYYLKSKEQQTRKRDRTIICKLRGLTCKKNADLFGVLILATSSISRSTRGKYVATMRTAAKQGVTREDFPNFVKQPKKRTLHQKTLPSNIPKLRVVHSQRR